jgi:DNA-binding response OmpR family regulator
MSIKVLIIENEPALVTVLYDYLDARGFDCDSAVEAAEAQALLAHVPFDVVLTDIYLSDLHEADGLRVLSFIRERALNVRLIVMTAHASPELESEAIRLGADAVLHKPVALSVLAAALTAASGSRV